MRPPRYFQHVLLGASALLFAGAQLLVMNRSAAMDRRIATPIAACGFEDAGDVFDNSGNRKCRGHLPGQARAVGRRLALRHQQTDDPLGTERPRGQTRDHAAVDAARESDDDAAAAQVMEHLIAQRPGDVMGDRGRVDVEHRRRQIERGAGG